MEPDSRQMAESTRISAEGGRTYPTLILKQGIRCKTSSKPWSGVCWQAGAHGAGYLAADASRSTGSSRCWSSIAAGPEWLTGPRTSSLLTALAS
jgi:hypothetical protein